MRVLVGVLGILLVAFDSVDALWTTLWVDGQAGPMTARHNSLTRMVMLRVARGNHRVLSMTGPIVLVTSVLVWALLAWFGWTMVLSGSLDAVLNTQTHAPAGFVDRYYFTGYNMLTVGNGDFTPNGGFWQVVTGLAGLDGLFMLTLSVTYLLAVIQAVVAKRAFGSAIWAIGRDAEEFVIHCWDGDSFRLVELQTTSLTEQLTAVTEQHHAYPMLHYYHESVRKQSVASNIAVFSEVILILAHGVPDEVRPARSALFSAQRTVEDFLDTLQSAYVEPADRAARGPDLSRLRAAGIPTVSDEEFARAIEERDERRRLLCGFLESEQREWPRLGDGR